jgi:hypothetical protein
MGKQFGQVQHRHRLGWPPHPGAYDPAQVPGLVAAG